MFTGIKIFIAVLLGLSTCTSFARPIQIRPPEELFADSKLVFIGRVNSTKPSGITIKFGYPTWENATFEWISADVDVLEAFKGVKPSAKVTTYLLSMKMDHKSEMMYSPPGMVYPNPGDVFLFCLGPTPIPNAYASISGPYDDYLAVIALHRAGTNAGFLIDDNFLIRRKEYQCISNLVDAAGNILTNGVKSLRTKYAKEFAKKGSKMVYLKWESRTNQSGWHADFPKGH